MTRPVTLFLTTFFLLVAPVLGAAHEFTVTFLVEQGRTSQTRTAFLLASGERDSHPDQTSEGHLGGLDSQLEIVLPGQNLPRSDVVVAIDPALLPVDLGPAIGIQMTQVSPRARAIFFETGPGSFEYRFARDFGAPPDQTALLTYLAARLIDKAVRQQGGTDDPDAFLMVLEQYQ